MGFFGKLFRTTVLGWSVEDATKIDELRTANEIAKREAEQQAHRHHELKRSLEGIGHYARSVGGASEEDYLPRIKRIGALLKAGQYEAALLASKQGVRSGDKSNSMYFGFYGVMAEALAMLGRKDEALDAIEASIEWGNTIPNTLIENEYFDSIKGEPRFQIAVKSLEALSGS